MSANTGNDVSVKQLISDIERDLLFHIILNMRHRKISVGEAQLLAQDFLTLLPSKDKEELLNKLNELGKIYLEANQVYVKYAGPYEEEKRQEVLKAMRDHIKKGEIEQALAVAKGGY